MFALNLTFKSKLFNVIMDENLTTNLFTLSLPLKVSCFVFLVLTHLNKMERRSALSVLQITSSVPSFSKLISHPRFGLKAYTWLLIYSIFYPLKPSPFGLPLNFSTMFSPPTLTYVFLVVFAIRIYPPPLLINYPLALLPAFFLVIRLTIVVIVVLIFPPVGSLSLVMLLLMKLYFLMLPISLPNLPPPMTFSLDLLMTTLLFFAILSFPTLRLLR